MDRAEPSRVKLLIQTVLADYHYRHCSSTVGNSSITVPYHGPWTLLDTTP